MQEKNVIIRKAKSSDAPLLAQVVADAIGVAYATMYCGPDYIPTLTAVATLPGTQYSFRHALLAEVDGIPVGAVIGYDGALLPQLREETLRVIAAETGLIHFPIGDETSAGEYYVDSLAVLPHYRGMGIGQKLLLAAMQNAKAEGHRRVGLLVDQENPRAEQLYRSLGFEHVDERPFFGFMMQHMQCEM